MKRIVRTTFLIALMYESVFSGLAKESPFRCLESPKRWDGRVYSCEVRELTLQPSATWDLNGGQDGAISITEEPGDFPHLRAVVEAWGITVLDAKATLNSIRIDVNGGMIRAVLTDPALSSSIWSVNLDLSTSSVQSAKATTNNGGLFVNNTAGNLSFSSRNGAVYLTGVRGKVSGSSQNGLLVLQAAGREWNGEGADIIIGNGALKFFLPAGYNVHLDIQTRGTLSLDPALPIGGRGGNSISANLGVGGSPIRIRSGWGGVSIGLLPPQ